MTMARREFLGFAGIAGTAALGLLPVQAAGLWPDAGEGGTGSAVLLDTTLCAGCRRCEAACAKEGRTPVRPDRAAHPAGPVEQPGMRERPCSACRARLPRGEAPACVRACETGALSLGPAAEGAPGIASVHGQAGGLAGPVLVGGMASLWRVRDRTSNPPDP
jgi:Fe-S-cluster-containing dehydrogenase component